MKHHPSQPAHQTPSRTPYRIQCVAAPVLALLLAIPALAQPTLHPDLSAADQLQGADTPALYALLEGRMEDAESLLHTSLAQQPSDALAHQLLCRVFYAEDKSEDAVRQCELATRFDPHSSTSFDWLGRAYGQKARHANPLAAFALARKVHASFETAVQLDPQNEEAIGDLGDYYVEAPAVVGGGDEKARALATRILPRFPSTAHGILAALAESDKDFPTAEREWKLALSTARGSEAQSHAWLDLAQFYRCQGRPDDALAAVRSGLAIDRVHGSVLVDAANVLTAIHREPALAEHCLREYLVSRARTDSAPAFKVHLQLAALLAARGDSTEAGREIETANELAPGFHRTHQAQGI